MQFLSTSDFEPGVIAVGGRPVGIVALGMNPIGVISVGIVPVGVIAFGCGASFGVVSVCCGVAGGIWTRVCGLGLGAESEGVGLAVSLAGPGGPLYWPRFLLVVALVIGLMAPIGEEARGRMLMSRVVETTWTGTVEKSEGLYLEPGSPCTVFARLRSDGAERLVVYARVECGSLTLVEQDRMWDCRVHQEDGFRYDLACLEDPVVYTDDDGPDEEVPGLSIQGGVVKVWAKGPPPMATEIHIEPWSEPWEGAPLLTSP